MRYLFCFDSLLITHHSLLGIAAANSRSPSAAIVNSSAAAIIFDWFYGFTASCNTATG